MINKTIDEEFAAWHKRHVTEEGLHGGDREYARLVWGQATRVAFEKFEAMLNKPLPKAEGSK